MYYSNVSADSRLYVPPHVLRDPLCLLALGFGAGLSPRAPGTAGTLLAVPLYWLLKDLPPTAYLAILLVGFIGGVGLCGYAARRLGVPDHRAIVWDEIIGFGVTMVGAPAGWPWVVAGFVLFRGFDIIKPWPIGWLDREVEGGLGVMLDDVMAGVYACACIQATSYLL